MRNIATAREINAIGLSCIGKSTFIPNKPVIKVNGSNTAENTVSTFIISFVLLVCKESNVSDKP
jgi:hypothetical protein